MINDHSVRSSPASSETAATHHARSLTPCDMMLRWPMFQLVTRDEPMFTLIHKSKVQNETRVMPCGRCAQQTGAIYGGACHYWLSHAARIASIVFLLGCAAYVSSATHAVMSYPTSLARIFAASSDLPGNFLCVRWSPVTQDAFYVPSEVVEKGRW